MIEVQPKDSRGYFMLPQAPEDSGYYVYGKIDGKPSHGAFQYAPPSMMSVILRVAREWQAIDNRKFGVGDISLAGGPPTRITSRTRRDWRWMSGRCVRMDVRSQ